MTLIILYEMPSGYLISVSGPTEQPLEPNDCPEGWVFQFMTNNTLYFKSDKMHDLDECIGDVNTLIADREIEIIQSLQAEVLNYSDNITTMCERLAVLDCLLSLADAARRYQWIRPEMCEDVVLDIRDGRHPIQELVDENFVANDVYAVGGTPSSNHSESSSSSQEKTGNSIVICTGANASGKSIYLKQCALIPYLAQVGSFVPAASARLGIIHRIFTRIQTRESVSKMQSALMIELNQVSLAIRHGTTPRTIVLLDEFGKGTLSSDGAGLFTGVIKHFLSLGDMCPLVIAATHFHEIFDASMLSPDLPISFVHMSVMITNTSGSVLETDADNAAIPDKGEKREGDRLVRPGEAVTYLFKVSPGLCLHSHASKCALTWGISPRIVSRAEHVSGLLQRNEINLLLDEQMSDREREELLESEAICRRFLEWDLTGFIDRGELKDCRVELANIVDGAR